MRCQRTDQFIYIRLTLVATAAAAALKKEFVPIYRYFISREICLGRRVIYSRIHTYAYTHTYI